MNKILKKKIPPLCSTDLVTGSPGDGEQRPSCCLRNSPFISSSPCSCICRALFFSKPVAHSLNPCCCLSCLHCRGSSLAELLPVQVCPPVSGSGLDTANSTQGPNAIFCLAFIGDMFGPCAVGCSADFRDTLSLAKQSWRCHGAWFQRCRTETLVIHSGISTALPPRSSQVERTSWVIKFISLSSPVTTSLDQLELFDWPITANGLLHLAEE